MKIRGLDGKLYTWSLAQYVGRQNTNPSDLHLRVREFLYDSFPALQILEEVYIESEHLYLDFYLPVKKIAIEAMGDQHFIDNRFHFKNKLDFCRAQTRDVNKYEFCRINGINLLYFYPEEDLEAWQIKIGLKTLTFPKN